MKNKCNCKSADLGYHKENCDSFDVFGNPKFKPQESKKAYYDSESHKIVISLNSNKDEVVEDFLFRELGNFIIKS